MRLYPGSLPPESNACHVVCALVVVSRRSPESRQRCRYSAAELPEGSQLVGIVLDLLAAPATCRLKSLLGS